MNRILLADVILTLTAEQAARLIACLDYSVRTTVEPGYRDLYFAVREQCAKQGVAP